MPSKRIVVHVVAKENCAFIMLPDISLVLCSVSFLSTMGSLRQAFFAWRRIQICLTAIRIQCEPSVVEHEVSGHFRGMCVTQHALQHVFSV